MDLPPSLARPFRLVAFDWDGTAVADRSEDAGRVRRPIERLLRAGVRVVVITGTNSDHIDRQLSAGIRGPHKRNLFLGTNRGSEVWGFDGQSAKTLVWQREATPREDRLLSETAEAVRCELAARAGLDIRIVHDRLNRRKVDLIPEWPDPPKDALAELLSRVEARLAAGGVQGGLMEVFAVARRAADDSGLTEARITSDVKHIEIGLTDKADSVRWLLRELAAPLGIAAGDILIGGDEFGPIAGFPGSDSLMIVPEAEGAAFVSVGPEPGGVPDPVLHLGGGPAAFRGALEAQAALYPVPALGAPAPEPSWTLVAEGFVPAREHEEESVFCVSNGYVGCRGSLAEREHLSSPATFVAGIFDRPPGPYSVPDLVRLPDWTRLSVLPEGEPLRLDSGEALEHRRTLDMRQGILWRHWRHRDPQGRVTRIGSMRLAAQSDRRLLLQSMTLTPENYGGQVSLESRFRRVEQVGTSRGEAVVLALESLLESPEGYAHVAGEAAAKGLDRAELEVELGKTYRLDRLAAVSTSKDSPRPAEESSERLDRLLRTDGVEGLLDSHRRAWEARWRDSDVRVEGDPAAQQALRFAAYHLLSAADPDSELVSIGARALTGASYKGHVFWDTEIFMLPFFTWTFPAAARSMLMYRYHTLPAARAKAARNGCRGAQYAWESADTGEEATPPFLLAPDGQPIRILCGVEEIHISADIAYAVWDYWRATGDDAFLLDAGAEIVIETARFWASRSEAGPDGLRHIRGVIGPDEYHESVDDNAYTNGMAQWNLERAAELAGLLAGRWPERWASLSRRLAVEEDEPREWGRLASRMYTGFDPGTRLFEQFRGYFGKDYVNLSAYEPRSATMEVLLGRERLQRSQVIKQADVVMLICLLWDRFPPEVREANFRFYEPRTDHGSSLSPGIHALMAARLGDIRLAERYFRQTMEIDLFNSMGNAAGGVHAAALGGLWQAAVLGFGGLTPTPDGPRAEPRLPPSWRKLSFSAQWRGRRHDFDLVNEAAARAASAPAASGRTP